MQTDYTITTALGEQKWHTVTLADLKEGQEIRTLFEEVIEDWLPNHTTDNGWLKDTNDLIERVEGAELSDGHRLDLGSDYDSPEWRRMKAIARQIARESA